MHVFKWLELRSIKQEKKQTVFQSENINGQLKSRNLSKNNQFDSNNIDWTFLNMDHSLQMYAIDEVII